MTDKTDKKEIVIDSEQGAEASEVSKTSSHETDSSHHTKEKNRVQKVFRTTKDFLKNHKTTLVAILLILSVFVNLLFAFWIHEIKEHSSSRYEGKGRGMNAYSYTSYIECSRGECFHQTIENGKPSQVEHFHADDFINPPFFH